MPSARSVAFRRGAIEAAGGYPEWLAIGEDMWVNRRWRELGLDMRFAPDAVVHWRLRPTLRATWAQYFRYARGDAQAGMFPERHALRFGGVRRSGRGARLAQALAEGAGGRGRRRVRARARSAGRGAACRTLASAPRRRSSSPRSWAGSTPRRWPATRWGWPTADDGGADRMRRALTSRAVARAARRRPRRVRRIAGRGARRRRDPPQRDDVQHPRGRRPRAVLEGGRGDPGSRCRRGRAAGAVRTHAEAGSGARLVRGAAAAHDLALPDPAARGQRRVLGVAPGGAGQGRHDREHPQPVVSRTPST